MKEICASAATLIAAGRSVRCAAAEIASGKTALDPAPIRAKPRSETEGAGEKKTRRTPAVITQRSTRATRLGEWRSTKPSAKKRVTAWAKAKQVTARPARKGPAAKISRM